MAKRLATDRVLLGVAVILFGAGLLMLWSASQPFSESGARVNGEEQQLRRYDERLEFENRNCLLHLVRRDFSFLAADWRHEADPAFDGRLLAQMAILLEFLPVFLHGVKSDG